MVEKLSNSPDERTAMGAEAEQATSASKKQQVTE